MLEILSASASALVRARSVQARQCATTELPLAPLIEPSTVGDNTVESGLALEQLRYRVEHMGYSIGWAVTEKCVCCSSLSHRKPAYCLALMSS